MSASSSLLSSSLVNSGAEQPPLVVAALLQLMPGGRPVHWNQFQTCYYQIPVIGTSFITMENCRTIGKTYLPDRVFGVVDGAVLADAFFFLEVVEEDDLFFLFFSAALATASLCGNTIPVDGVATTRLVSVLLLAAFFCLFFGRPLQKTIVNRKCSSVK